MKPHNITFRSATHNDIPLLEYWDQQQHVHEASGNDEWPWEKELAMQSPHQQQLIAELDGQPIGFVQIIDPALEQSHYWGDVQNDLRAIDIWIGEAKNLNKGYGTEMMRLTIERCFSEPNVKAILIDPLKSNEKALRFYERMGFSRIEERMFGDDECYVYQLTRDEWITLKAVN
jgi:aminoglycoside 6'-N-acetyltransferase